MATGAVFQIIANDGRADRLIFATQLLNQRIKDIMCKRYNAGLYDISPTLADIGQSHVLLTDAKFKPLVAIGYEYNHAPTSSGTAAFGDTMTFSIPQFGDFFNDMVLSWHWSSFTGTEFTNPTQGTGDYANDDTPAAGTTSSTHTLVDSFGMAINDGETNNHLVRYVEYPAEAAIKKVSFHVNGNPLDAYGTETKVFLRKFMLDPGKAYGYRTLVGQENELEGYTDLQSSSQVDSDPSTSGTIAGDSVGRMKISVVNGPQTPKAVQPELHCMYPLDFSWNKSVALSIPSVSIPFGQRYMSFDLNKVEDVVRMAPNAYVRKVSTTYNAGGILPANVTSRIVEHISVPVVRSPELVGPTWKKAQLIINNLFVNPEIHDIYIKRIGFTLLRVFREHNFQTSDTNGQNLLAGLKWPVEYMFVGFRPVFNTKNTNDNIWRDWHRMHKTRSVNWNMGSTVTGSNGEELSADYTIDGAYYTQQRVVDTVGIHAHGVPIYDNFDAAFFNSYTPYHYGGDKIVTPEDVGALMINFCLYPGTYQPTGHINVSRAREFYMSWNSSYISEQAPTKCFVTAVCINFLLISDGSAVLRYST